MKARNPFIFLLLVFCCLPSAVLADQAVVKRVIDGDTVVLEDNTRVRLIGIDAPEIENREYAHRGEPYGEEAKQVLKEWVEGRRVELKNGPELKDKYNRRLAYLYRDDGFFVNLQLVEAGAAEAYRRFPHPQQKDFFDAEARAQSLKAGMWSKPARKRTAWQRLWGIQPK